MRSRVRHLARTRGRAILSCVLSCVLAAGLLAAGCGRSEWAPKAGQKNVIVLGFDGMDWALVNELMGEGRLPNFSRLARTGHAQALMSSVPPLSPVAWSTFITGMDPGGHGIFDFVHRDPKTMIPYLSTSRAEAASDGFDVGKYHIPLGSGKVELLRHGIPFWQILHGRGIPTTVIRIPANYPPSGTADRELSGMGTPDVLGTYGTFSFYNSAVFAEDRDVPGGHLYPLDYDGTVATGELYGPDNPFLAAKTPLAVPFTVYPDSEKPAAVLEIGDERRLLEAGEWSGWVPIEFTMIPTQHLAAEVRFYLRQVQPEIELYASPINLDPMSPAQPISTPPGFAAELAAATGRFYTQGMPEDTKAITDDVFDVDEFLAQAKIANDEIRDQYRYLLDRFHGGLLFYYFGSTDQVAHILWRSLDPSHPAYDAAKDAPYADVIPRLYEMADGVVGETLAHLRPDTVLVVMSDHGFTSWKRAFSLNTWLQKAGYLVLSGPPVDGKQGLYQNVDWSRTRAYGLGINGLYVNLAGREKNGIVPVPEKAALMHEIRDRLTKVIDPASGRPAVDKVFIADEDYDFDRYLDIGPDMIVGYAKGTRCSNESALGEVTTEMIVDNTDRWSGDHSMDPATVPGILFTSEPLPKKVTSLEDLAAAVLAEFGIESFPPAAERPEKTARR